MPGKGSCRDTWSTFARAFDLVLPLFAATYSKNDASMGCLSGPALAPSKLNFLSKLVIFRGYREIT